MFEKLFKHHNPSQQNSHGIIKFYAERLDELTLKELITELFNANEFTLASEISKLSYYENLIAFTQELLLVKIKDFLHNELIFHSKIPQNNYTIKLTVRKQFEFVSYFSSIFQLGFSYKFKKLISDFILNGHKILTIKIFDAILKSTLKHISYNLNEKIGLYLFGIQTKNDIEFEKVNAIINIYFKENVISGIIFNLSVEFTSILKLKKNELFEINNHNIYSFENYFLIEISLNKNLDLNTDVYINFINTWLLKFENKIFHQIDLLNFLAKFNYQFHNFNFLAKIQALEKKLDDLCEQCESPEQINIQKLNFAKYLVEHHRNICNYLIFHLEKLEKKDLITELINITLLIKRIKSKLNILIGFEDFNEFNIIQGVKRRKKNFKIGYQNKDSYLIEILNRDYKEKSVDIINYLDKKGYDLENRITLKNIEYGFSKKVSFSNESNKNLPVKVDLSNPNLELFYIEDINYNINNSGQMFTLSIDAKGIYSRIKSISLSRFFGKVEFWILKQILLQCRYSIFSDDFLYKIEVFYGYKPSNNIHLDLNNNDVYQFIKSNYPIFYGIIQSCRKKTESWNSIISAYNKNQICKGRVIRQSNQGVIVDVFGIETFLAGNQIETHKIIGYDDYLDKEIDFKIIYLNENTLNIKISRRVIYESRFKEEKKQIYSNLEKGLVLVGSVKNITSYGIFIDLGGVDGLIHITDLSWGRITHPDEVLTLNQQVNVVILDFDVEKDRIALGLKQLQPHPWDCLDSNIKVGDTINGKVVVINKYGAFIEIKAGIEGLIHVSEMSWSQYMRAAQDFLKIGDSVKAVVLTIDPDERKMSLSIKQLMPDPWNDIENKYTVRKRYHSKVRNFTSFGVFVELEEGIDGLIHISDLSWQKKIKHPSEFCKVGDTIDVLVLEIDRDNRRISLGHKQLDFNNNIEKLKTKWNSERTDRKNKRSK